MCGGKYGFRPEGMDKGDLQHKTDIAFKPQRKPIQDDSRIKKVEYRTVMMVRWMPPLYFEVALPSTQQPMWSILATFVSLMLKGLVVLFSTLKRWCLVKSLYSPWLPNTLTGESWGWGKSRSIILTMVM